MRHRSAFCTLVLAVSVAIGGLAEASAPQGESLRAASSLSISGPKQAVEGDRIKLAVLIAAPRTAKSVQLQTLNDDIYGNPKWESIKRSAAQGKRKHTFTVTATELNVQRFRALVVQRQGKPVISRPISVKVWRWIDLSSFDSYYDTPGTIESEYLSFPMSGHQYKGWHTGGSYGAWESRYTLGRHCTRLRAVLGVTDDSSDGSSGQVRLMADEEPVFESNSLIPGAVQVANLPLASPYRLTIIATDTSTADETAAFPAIGTPQFLCSGL